MQHCRLRYRFCFSVPAILQCYACPGSVNKLCACVACITACKWILRYMKGNLLTVTNSLVDACGLLKFQSVASSTRMQVHCTCHAGLHIVLLMQTSIILCSASNAHCLASAVVHAVLLWHM